MRSSPVRRRFPWHIVVFLAPAVIVYTLFMIYPLLNSLRLSFFTRVATERVFVGLDNYVTLFTNPNFAPQFRNAFANNMVFFAVHMLVQNPIGLLLAGILAARVKGHELYRTVLFMPTVLSVVIIGFIWNLILNPLWGVSSTILELVGLESLYRPWLGLESSALVTVSLISVWQFVGIPMILFYTSLIGIPDELTEAARVDGATAWQIFWRVKFPLLLPTVGIVAILTFVGNFNAFDLIYTMKGALAGPNFATDLMGTFFYRTYFGQQLQLGNVHMGATVATMMFLIILAGVLIYMVFWQRRITSYEM